MLRATRTLRDPVLVMAEAAKIAAVIRDAVNPLTIYLFGSACEGKATDHSDFDFLVVMSDEAEIKQAQASLRPFRPLSKYPVDIVWMSESDFNAKSRVGGVALIAFEDGITIYEREKTA